MEVGRRAPQQIHLLVMKSLDCELISCPKRPIQFCSTLCSILKEEIKIKSQIKSSFVILSHLLCVGLLLLIIVSVPWKVDFKMSSISGKHMFNDLTIHTSVYIHAHTHTHYYFIIIFLVGFS